MIFPINSIKYKVAGTNQQQGVTLLLALLVLSAVMAIAFSLATILLVEIRVAGDLMRTEPAIYAANAVTEEALFTIKRGYTRCTGASCQGNKFFYTTQLGNVAMNNPAPKENPYNDAIVIDKVDPTSTTLKLTKNRYALYDPADINLPSGYGRLRVTFKDTGETGKIHVYVCEFKAPQNFNQDDEPVDCDTAYSPNMIHRDVGPSNDPSGGLDRGETTVDMDIDPTKQQELIIYTTYSSGGEHDRWVQIESFASDRTTPKGIPYFGQTVVDINADNAGVTRSIRVKIPEN